MFHTSILLKLWQLQYMYKYQLTVLLQITNCYIPQQLELDVWVGSSHCKLKVHSHSFCLFDLDFYVWSCWSSPDQLTFLCNRWLLMKMWCIWHCVIHNVKYNTQCAILASNNCYKNKWIDQVYTKLLCHRICNRMDKMSMNQDFK